MADIKNLARFITGLPREVDVSLNTLQVNSLKVGTSSPAELTEAMTALWHTTTNLTGLPGANLSDEAKQNVLEQKYVATHIKCNLLPTYTGFVPTTGNTSDVVTQYVTDAATTDSPVGGGEPPVSISLVAAKGIFVGTVSGANDIGKVLIRFYGGDNGVDDGTGDEIYGVLSESSGVYTLSYKTANGDPYTITADDTAAKFTFYFVEVSDLYAFHSSSLLNDAVGGVVDSTTSEALGDVSAAREAADITLQANIDAEESARIAADDAEASARADEDITLGLNIDAESTPRIASDDTLQINIEAESTPRAAADVTLQANIDVEATARADADITLQANIDAESTPRADADVTLQANLDSEITSRIDADTTLQANLDIEITARIAADDAEYTARTVGGAGVPSEALSIDGTSTSPILKLSNTTWVGNSFTRSTSMNITRVSTKFAQSGAISAGSIVARIYATSGGIPTSVLATSTTTLDATTIATSATWYDFDIAYTTTPDTLYAVTFEGSGLAGSTASIYYNSTNPYSDGTQVTTLDGGSSWSVLAGSDLSLKIQETTLSISDTSLQSDIDAEITARSDADTTLQANLDAEITARSDADTTLQANIDAEATARADADTTLQANIDAEITSRENVDATLQADIDAEATIRADADVTFQAAIDAEESARIAGDNVSIDSEITARTEADSSLQSLIDAEAISRDDVDTTLQANIDTEITARTTADDAEATLRSDADATIQAAIDAEATLRSDADATLQAALDVEESARIAADATIQANLDNINFTRIDVSFIAGEDLTAGDIVVASKSVAGEVVKANATSFTTCEDVVGVAIESKLSTESVIIRTFGVATVTTDGTNFDLGKRVYVHTTAGQGSKSAPNIDGNVVYLLGNATSATNQVFINSSLEYVVGEGLGDTVPAGGEAVVPEGEELLIPAT